LLVVSVALILLHPLLTVPAVREISKQVLATREDTRSTTQEEYCQSLIHIFDKAEKREEW